MAVITPGDPNDPSPQTRTIVGGPGKGLTVRLRNADFHCTVGDVVTITSGVVTSIAIAATGKTITMADVGIPV